MNTGGTIVLRACLLPIVLVVAAACAIAQESRTVELPQPGIRPFNHISGIFDYRTAVVSISAIFERELGRPAFPVTFEFFAGRGALETALLESGYDPSLARDTARTMGAIGGYRRVLLNDSELGPLSWPDRVALLAHELAHTLQYELGGGRRGTSEQWLREGFAEWMSMRVLARLGAMPEERFRRRKLEEARGVRGSAPALGAMASFPQWVALNSGRDPGLYARAFIATDLLIERHGVQAVLGYFGRFALSQDRAGHFRAAFGEDLAEFERVFDARVRRDTR